MLSACKQQLCQSSENCGELAASILNALSQMEIWMRLTHGRDCGVMRTAQAHCICVVPEFACQRTIKVQRSCRLILLAMQVMQVDVLSLITLVVCD